MVNWDSSQPKIPIIKVLGVGGGGCNAVQSMVRQGFKGVEFYGVNTDYQALQRCEVPNRIQIGEGLTGGSGAGALPSIGEQAAREAEDKLREILQGTDMVFIAAGLGGGTGTGAAPVIAEIARSMDILNVAIVTRPFSFEGPQRMKRAMEGYKKLSEHVDTMIAILNDKLMEVVGPKTALTEAFEVANTVLAQGIRAISDLIALPGLINVDFRDVRTIMGETGGAVMGVGIGKGENRAVEAVRKACHSPLQEKIVIDGARGILINITGPDNITMHEINEATTMVYDVADPEANIIFGVVIDETMKDELRVTIIATGFGNADPHEAFGSGLYEKPRPRANRLQIHEPLAPQGMGGAGESNLERPTIMRKREQREPAPEPKIDFESPGNPLSEWGAGDEGKDNEPTPAKAQASEASGHGAPVLSDSEGAEVQTGGVEDPYELPALQRRRRQRFFE